LQTTTFELVENTTSASQQPSFIAFLALGVTAAFSPVTKADEDDEQHHESHYHHHHPAETCL
jgi:hypothetical protein